MGHVCLTLGNILVSWISGLILYGTLAVFAMINGYAGILGRIMASMLFMMIYVAIVSVLASAISVVFPTVVTGVIMILILAGGAFRSILGLAAAVLTGTGGWMVKRLLKLIPDLAGLSRQGGNLVQGKPVDVHVIVMGLLVIWIAGLGLLLFKRQEA